MILVMGFKNLSNCFSIRSFDGGTVSCVSNRIGCIAIATCRDDSESSIIRMNLYHPENITYTVTEPSDLPPIKPTSWYYEFSSITEPFTDLLNGKKFQTDSVTGNGQGNKAVFITTSLQYVNILEPTTVTDTSTHLDTEYGTLPDGTYYLENSDYRYGSSATSNLQGNKAIIVGGITHVTFDPNDGYYSSEGASYVSSIQTINMEQQTDADILINLDQQGYCTSTSSNGSGNKAIGSIIYHDSNQTVENWIVYNILQPDVSALQVTCPTDSHFDSTATASKMMTATSNA